MDRFHVLTGAPGTGKTTILENLGSDISVVPEPARRVLETWRAEGNPLPARMDPDMMIERMIDLATRDLEMARRRGPVVFDRGLIDCVAYARHLDRDDTRAVAAVGDHRYSERVLLTAPWREIYATDDERTMDFEDVERFHATVVRTYLDAGYELIVVPNASLAERVAFVRRHLGSGD
ncbi:MAG TPA: AAA family ATPase [Acidimicrobiia bacterium]|nr:AAA family ATPase [Acidimicrobiia bacterium]